MSSRPRPKGWGKRKTINSAALRSWRVSLIRNRGHVLGDVEAATRDAAEAAAMKKFNLSPEQRNRIVIQERA
jgi:hypothetical protein